MTGRRINIRQKAIPYQAEYDGESGGGDLEEGAPLSGSDTEVEAEKCEPVVSEVK